MSVSFGNISYVRRRITNEARYLSLKYHQANACGREAAKLVQWSYWRFAQRQIICRLQYIKKYENRRPVFEPPWWAGQIKFADEQQYACAEAQDAPETILSGLTNYALEALRSERIPSFSRQKRNSVKADS